MTATTKTVRRARRDRQASDPQLFEHHRNFLANVGSLLNRTGATQRGIARKLKMHPVSINTILKQHRRPSDAFASRIASAFGLEYWMMFVSPSHFTKLVSKVNLEDWGSE